MGIAIKYRLEDDVNDYVKRELERVGLVKGDSYNVESSMSERLKEALRGGSKTQNKTGFGKPDFSVECYQHAKRTVPVLIEDKLGSNKLVSETKNDGIRMDDRSIRSFALNGALQYGRTVLAADDKYSDAIIIGVAGDDDTNVQFDIRYLFGKQTQPKPMHKYKDLSFLESQATFDEFMKHATLSEEEQHQLLVQSKEQLAKEAKKLNKLMNNHNIGVSQRVILVSGMLLSMQDIVEIDPDDPNRTEIFMEPGLTPDSLTGSGVTKDGKRIVRQIDEYLKARGIEYDKRKMMMQSFEQIGHDADREDKITTDKLVSKWIDGDASINKQIFTFIYETIFKSIDGSANTHLDIMGELYSEFLKYALGDGKGIGIVLTPPYVTKLMVKILGVNKDSRVMDLATGSAGFLISAMAEMTRDAAATLGGHDATATKKKIVQIKQEQLLGVELQSQMYTLATTNMILRGDGSTQIEKGDSFKPSKPNLYKDFEPDVLLLNPPFSYSENGMPFLQYGLDQMVKGGKAAIIIQDSAGSGKAVITNKKILAKHTLLYSIKMPTDLFEPNAGVQTSVYVFEAGTPHDFDIPVKFIDFRNDGYKRTKRGIKEIDAPEQRYADLLQIIKSGKASASKLQADWDLDAVYAEDFIDNSGSDWNFEKHQVIDTKVTLEDFKATVGDYMAWQISTEINS